MDESGISTVQKRCQKVSGQKGKKQIGSLSSGERGTTTTIVCCVNASGTHYVPPMVIFKRKQVPPELGDGAPPGTVVACSDSGWMDGERFAQWLKHFVQCVKPCPDKKVLLVLDGHKSHTKNLQAIEIARDNNVIKLSLPPHTTHKTQPLDRAFFKPLQTFYDQAAEKWLRTNPGRSITCYQIGRLFGEAYVMAATMRVAIKGFEASGIWPCSRNVFQEQDFAPSFAPQHSDAGQQPSPILEAAPQQPPTPDAAPQHP